MHKVSFMKVLLFYETFASTLEMHKLEDSEIERYFMRETNACDEFYPLQYYKLSKALDLTPVINEVQNLISRPLPVAIEIPENFEICQSDSPLQTSGSSSETSESRKRPVGSLFNFETICKRKWLKRLLLEFDANVDGLENDNVSDMDIDIMLKFHSFKKKWQTKFSNDILNSQYAYYSSGLLSEYDRYPEHRKFVLDQYGFEIPKDLQEMSPKPLNKRRRNLQKSAGTAVPAEAGQTNPSFICPCGPKSCRCGIIRRPNCNLDPKYLHLWNVIVAYDVQKAFQLRHVGSKYRESVLKNLAYSCMAFHNRASQKAAQERGRNAVRSAKKVASRSTTLQIPNVKRLPFP
ncbi:DNA helicase INO80 [Trichinella zimbabwensis]|uniref:DNA helicase INO80 n=1 Tax=Trichinella zimbabwensis TaxID=268475 RepID=A0A0V1H563_9BILA|nr:DNA helicase INO80 [Trichinella zimbabwensis]